MKRNRLICFLAIMSLVLGFVSCKTGANDVNDGKFAVSITAEGPGTVEMKDSSGKILSSGSRVQKGEKVLFYAKTDYSVAHIEKWIGVGKPVKRRKSLSLNVERDLNIIVVFKEGVLETYNIEFMAENGGGVVRGFVVNGSEEEEVASPYDAVKDEKLIFRAEPSKHSLVNASSDWTGSADLQVKSSSNNLEAELVVKKEAKIKVRFSVEAVKLTFNAHEDNGTVHAILQDQSEMQRPGVLTVPKGSEVRFIAKPKENYSAVFAGARKVKPNEAILKMEKDATVTVSFDSLVDVNIFGVQNGVEFPKGMEDELNGHLDKSFCIGRYPVTYELWYKVREFAERRGYEFGIFCGMGGYVGQGRLGVPPKDLGLPPTSLNKNHPVTVVDWPAAIIWCNAYSEWAGLEPVYYTDASLKTPVKCTNNAELLYAVNNCVVKEDANGYRMLTADEWEFAARLTLDTVNAVPDGNGSFFYVNVNNNKYYFTKGDSACGALKNYQDKDATQEVAYVYIEHEEPANGESSEVGKKKPSSLGLYDITGNAKTWVFDNPSTSYFKPFLGVWQEPTYYRCIRGASFGAPPPEAVDIYKKPKVEIETICIGYCKAAYIGVWMGGGFALGLRVGRNLDN